MDGKSHGGGRVVWATSGIANGNNEIHDETEKEKTYNILLYSHVFSYRFLVNELHSNLFFPQPQRLLKHKP